MQPARIRVFDGLRITTEHLEHLQEGVHSAVGDLRQALGLGRVQYGFEVEAQGDAAIVVGAGLAFDRQRERIVSDQPIRVVVSFEPGQDALYVVVGHRTVEEGEVEGRTTIVWDSCEVRTVAARPASTDNFVTLAKLVPAVGPGGPTFEIVPAEPATEPQAENGNPPQAGVPEDSTGLTPSDATAAPNGSSTATPRVALAGGTVQARQGVVRLAGAAGSEAGGGATLESALRARLPADASAGGEAPAAQGDPVVELAVADVSLGFDPLTVTAHLRLSAVLAAPTPSPAPSVDGAPASDPSSTEAKAYRWEASGQGEATIEGAAIAQFGWLTIRPTATGAPSGPAPEADDAVAPAWAELPAFSERGLAELPLQAKLGDFATDPTAELLSHLSLVVEATPAVTSDLRLRCLLTWSGAVNEASIQAVHERWSAFEWRLLLAWNALGVQR